MSMKLSEVKAKVKEAQVEWDGEVVDFGYHPGATTPELLEKVMAVAGGDQDSENIKVLGIMLEPMLSWWDVLDDDDKRLPTDAATINLMPVPFLTALLAKVQEDFRPPASRN